MDAKYVIAIFLCVLVSFVHGFHASDLPTPVEGLSWTFYEESCPNLKSIVKSILDEVLKQNITQAPGLLRLLFHDCFVQGCDASILLNGTSSEPSEQEATPNLTLRAAAFEIINEIKEAVEANCSGVVSCADILALAASYAVFVAGGPEFLVPLGRRDSLTFASQTVTDDNIPSPTSNVTVLMTLFTEKGFESFTDLVALSGAHTFGIGHCSAFVDRLYPTQDPTLNATFAKELEQTCPTNSTVNTTHLTFSLHMYSTKSITLICRTEKDFLHQMRVSTTISARNILLTVLRLTSPTSLNTLPSVCLRWFSSMCSLEAKERFVKTAQFPILIPPLHHTPS